MSTVAALTAVIIILVGVVVTVWKCKSRAQGIADFMSECVLVLLIIIIPYLQFNCHLFFSEKLGKESLYKQVYIYIYTLYISSSNKFFVVFWKEHNRPCSFTVHYTKDIHYQHPK